MLLRVKDLYELQDRLDAHIFEKFSLTRSETSMRRRLALLVELGECVNETRCFKFWSVKGASEQAVILEEFADGIHFLLSLGIDLHDDEEVIESKEASANLSEAYLSMYERVLALHTQFDLTHYHDCFAYYLGIGERLGFDEVMIREHYLMKNAENHHRQETNY